MATTTKKTGTGATEIAKTDKNTEKEKASQKACKARRNDAGKHLGEVTDRKRQPIRTICRIPRHGIQGRCGSGHKDARRPRTAGSADDKESPAAPPQNAGGGNLRWRPCAACRCRGKNREVKPRRKHRESERQRKGRTRRNRQGFGRNAGESERPLRRGAGAA